MMTNETRMLRFRRDTLAIDRQNGVRAGGCSDTSETGLAGEALIRSVRGLGRRTGTAPTAHLILVLLAVRRLRHPPASSNDHLGFDLSSMGIGWVSGGSLALSGVVATLE